MQLAEWRPLLPSPKFLNILHGVIIFEATTVLQRRLCTFSCGIINDPSGFNPESISIRHGNPSVFAKFEQWIANRSNGIGGHSDVSALDIGERSKRLPIVYWLPAPNFSEVNNKILFHLNYYFKPKYIGYFIKFYI
ncbi:hypothetical protein Dalk_2760 [Desulfatibacillum aliphaticivorans]|uniref:Uncharacterized protein n=1 Tax=Desulfatibacillum aliphaticivorans TaxID=218208 RepID=B8FKT0_DESAL|nr:hypothetical protein [Desulfatibacillum aliphaticivorans]ACL04452.1 hypothetical protein Dalk_2760 [Desulfatibacillum aliphaticivorans]